MSVSYADLSGEAVWSRTDDYRTGGFQGRYLDIDHRNRFELATGTIALSFSADRAPGEMALISKDGYGNGDGGGFTLWLADGTLRLSMETAFGTEWLSVPNVEVAPGERHHVAITFGAEGLELWLNGSLIAVETGFRGGIAANDDNLVIGGTRAWHDDNDVPGALFQGVVGDVMVFSRQLNEADLLTLVTEADDHAGAHATMNAQMADLMPVFGQMHHASDRLKDIASHAGFFSSGHDGNEHEHGHIPDLHFQFGSRNANTLTGAARADGIDGGLGDDTLDGAAGHDVLQGGYGNDALYGGDGNDLIDGGHGEDVLKGGKGNDVLISRADGREGAIAYDPDRDEGDPFNELTNGKVYADQPIPADDVMFGGAGADTFYFQTLINAKLRIIQKHTDADGKIDWHGVAGENANLHDHWVDVIGNDVVMDFNRAQGDSIVIEGHTTRIRGIVYGDSNGDGVMDRSTISIYSDQNGAGAHNQDELGTITVYGDLVTMADIETTSAPAYGIIVGYNDLDEAVRPLAVSADTGRIRAPGGQSGASATYKTTDPIVFAVNSQTQFHADDRIQLVFDHGEALELASGTIAMRFSVDSFDHTMGLFSKDADGNGSGGHLAAYVSGVGDLTIRLQGATETWYFSADGAIERGKDYDLAVSFGDDGLAVYLNGVRIAYDTELTQGWSTNTEKLIFGALGWGSTPGTADSVWSHLNGSISDIAIYGSQLAPDELYARTDWADVFKVDVRSEGAGFSYDRDGALKLEAGRASALVPTDARVIEMLDISIRVRDIQLGSARNEYLQGGDGADYLDGKAGNDNIWGRGNDDRIRGDAGHDTLVGEAGRDQLGGGDGNDVLYGGEHNDTMMGGAGHDTMVGGDGSDQFHGGIGDDHYYGQSWDAEGVAANDRAFFRGNFEDFEFETRTSFNGSRGQTMTTLIVTDSADGGLDGFYEGADRLVDIDFLVFADRTVAVVDLL
jgi:Ca2+-binding RTX toxin-like protein